MDTIRLSFGRYPSDNQTLLVHLIVPYSVPIQWSSNPLRSKAHCNRTLYRCKALYSIMNHFAGNCKFSLSTIVDIFICRNRLVSYTLEKQEVFIKFELWKPKTSNFAKKTSCFSWNALVDIHQNFICSSHSLNRKKRSESAQTAFMPIYPAQQNSTSVSAQTKSTKRSMQTVIYYHCPVHSYHPP